MIGVEHIRAFRAIPRCSVTAVADSNEEALIKVVDEFAISYSFSNYKDMLAMEELDAVVICAPPFAHEELVLASLAAGKHVLSEKPIGMTPESVQRMVKRARKSGKILASCSSRFRFSPTVLKAKEIIDSGELGDIYHIYISGISRRSRPGLDYHPAAKWSLQKSQAGGGALLDWGIYDLNILFGLIEDLKVERVDGFCFRGIDEPDLDKAVFDVEEHGGAILRCKGGLSVFWERSWAAHMNRRNRIRIYGSRAGVAFDPLTWPKNVFFEMYEDRSGKPVTIAPDTNFENCNVLLCVAQNFVEAIRKNTTPITSGDDEMKFLRVIHAVYRSHQKCTSVSI
jgi:predicted dehydrogenase